MGKSTEFAGIYAEYASNAESMDSLDAVELCMAIEEQAAAGDKFSDEDIKALAHVRQVHGENWEKMFSDMHETAVEELTRLGLWGKSDE